jgi:hypothetical protein
MRKYIGWCELNLVTNNPYLKTKRAYRAIKLKCNATFLKTLGCASAHPAAACANNIVRVVQIVKTPHLQFFLLQSTVTSTLLGPSIFLSTSAYVFPLA